MDLRERVVKLVREYYAEAGAPPSMRYIARALGVSTKTLYKVFPGGIREVYEAAGLKQSNGVPDEFADFLSLYREYLRLSGQRECPASICTFISEVQGYVRSRLGQAAASRLAEAPLSTFNRVARVYLKVRKGGADSA